MDHSMGSMTMGGEITLLDYPLMYWAVVCSVVGVATMVNLYNHLLYKQRLVVLLCNETSID